MLVMFIENQLITPHQVCQTCLMADQGGEPRWQSGQLRCGHRLPKISEEQPEQFECQMGFKIASIN
ncbi:MAG: hypothetical protein ACRDB1_06390 [Microcoleaceae cyanobacterium]